MTEIIEDSHWYTTVWECAPPPDGARFRVTAEEWTVDYTVRRIRAWELGSEGADPTQGEV